MLLPRSVTMFHIQHCFTIVSVDMPYLLRRCHGYAKAARRGCFICCGATRHYAIYAALFAELPLMPMAADSRDTSSPDAAAAL